jgi:hypothetical protein
MSWLDVVRYLKWKRHFRRASFPFNEWKSDGSIKMVFSTNPDYKF